jgi:hypothetical protein
MKGNVTFRWNDEKDGNFIKIKLGTSPYSDWIRTVNNQYMVTDILKYPNVTIKVSRIDGGYPTKTLHGETILFMFMYNMC